MENKEEVRSIIATQADVNIDQAGDDVIIASLFPGCHVSDMVEEIRSQCGVTFGIFIRKPNELTVGRLISMLMVDKDKVLRSLKT